MTYTSTISKGFNQDSQLDQFNISCHQLDVDQIQAVYNLFQTTTVNIPKIEIPKDLPKIEMSNNFSVEIKCLTGATYHIKMAEHESISSIRSKIRKQYHEKLDKFFIWAESNWAGTVCLDPQESIDFYFGKNNFYFGKTKKTINVTLVYPLGPISGRRHFLI